MRRRTARPLTVRTKGRPVHLNRVERPEYETLAMIGSNLGLTSSLEVMDGNDACNRLGLDTISSGAALSLVCELAERGWLPESRGTAFAAPSPSAPTPKGMRSRGALVTQRCRLPAALCAAQPGDGSLFGARWRCRGLREVVESMTGHPYTLHGPLQRTRFAGVGSRGKRFNALAYMTANVGASHMRAVGRPRACPVTAPSTSCRNLSRARRHRRVTPVRFCEGRQPDGMLAEAWTAITGGAATWDDLCARAAVQWDLACLERPIGAPLAGAPEDLLSWRLRKNRCPAVWPRCVSFRRRR